MASKADIRKRFPILERRLGGRPVVYFDNAATSQKPVEVIDLQRRLCTESNANIHRALHTLGDEMTDLYEKGREAVRSFIGAESREEIIFTSGTTASINLVAASFTEAFIRKGDRIVVCEAEHHSNLVPWQMACKRAGAELLWVPVDENGRIRLDRLSYKVAQPKVKLLAIAHVSNVLGVVNPLEDIISIAHSYGVPVLLDGAQGVVHDPVSVSSLGVDFYAFSGHKIYAPTGIGVLYGRREWLDRMPPYMGGGDMVGTVTLEQTIYAPLPLKFEAGTPNFIAAACMAPALEFASKVNSDASLMKNLREMTDFLMEGIGSMEGVRILGDALPKAPVISFVAEGAHHADIAQILDKMGIEVRSGLVCAEPLITSMGYTGVVRVSLMPYNTMQEAEYFLHCLEKTLSMLRK